MGPPVNEGGNSKCFNSKIGELSKVVMVVKKLRWSKWQPLTDHELEDVPEEPGVYEIKASFDIPRLIGKSPVLYIGGTLRGNSVYGRLGCFEEIFDKRKDKSWVHARKPLREFLKRKRISPEEIRFRYKICLPGKAKGEEARLLNGYEKKHLELPPFNLKRGESGGKT